MFVPVANIYVLDLILVNIMPADVLARLDGKETAMTTLIISIRFRPIFSTCQLFRTIWFVPLTSSVGRRDLAKFCCGSRVNPIPIRLLFHIARYKLKRDLKCEKRLSSPQKGHFNLYVTHHIDQCIIRLSTTKNICPFRLCPKYHILQQGNLWSSINTLMAWSHASVVCWLPSHQEAIIWE